jgi:predicted phage terminase large subunit-like protein
LLQQTVLQNKFIPSLGGKFPTPQQASFLTLPFKEILYGGAAGGGKSAAILAAALQYVEFPGYDALILRRSYADLEKPGALIPLSQSWLIGTEATYNQQSHRWTFPSGATLSFGFIQNEASVQQDYQGSAYAFIGFDELTQFSKFMYTYLFSRLRTAEGNPFPTRMRATSNPGGAGHNWVKSRFIDSPSESQLFVPAKLDDNPGLDKESYEQALEQLDYITRQQLRHGDWNIRPEGNLFKRAWFKIVDRLPVSVRKVRHWDLAATEPEKGKDPDYTAGVLMSADADNNVYIEDVKHERMSAFEVEKLIAQTARIDGKDVAIQMEEEGGASGKSIISHYARNVLFGYNFHGVKPGTDKVTRAMAFSAAAEHGMVHLVRGQWNHEFLDEITGFPQVAHDDQVDGATGAFGGLDTVAEFAEFDASEFQYSNDGSASFNPIYPRR